MYVQFIVSFNLRVLHKFCEIVIILFVSQEQKVIFDIQKALLQVEVRYVIMA